VAIVTLLKIPETEVGQKAFSFEHAMAHRQATAVMGPLSQWSILPYFIDPAQFDASPANKWNLNHQQAHNDFTSDLPAYSTALVPGIPLNQNLVDTNFKNPLSQLWWTFANHQEHFIANQAILPLNLTIPTDQLPFWAVVGRIVPTSW